MGPVDWVKIAKDIEAGYESFDGFVVIMGIKYKVYTKTISSYQNTDLQNMHLPYPYLIGTDTMAYAASALSFMLENLGKTVVFTGSQIPFCEVYNDARYLHPCQSWQSW
jgi:L-asparaginase